MTNAEMPVPWVLVAGGFHRDGGMDKPNLALAEYLVEMGTPIHVVCHRADRDFCMNPLVNLHQVPRPAGSYVLGEALLDIRGRWVAHRVRAQWPTAVVVVNGGNCMWPGINWVHYVHHAWQPVKCSGPAWFRIKNAITVWIARRRERSAYRKAQFLISNSNQTSRHLVEYFDFDAARIHTVYYGGESEWGPVTPEEHSASRQSLQIRLSRVVAIFVGALGHEDRKGFNTLLEAWRRLCATPEWDVDLLVAGSGNALEMWREKIAQYGLAHRIRLLGFTHQVPQLLAAADLLVSPARYESYGLNVQEAICRGIPVMVSAAAGVAERYGPEFTPMLIPDPEDCAALTDALLAWRSEKDQWLARFQAFGATLRSRNWRDMAAELTTLIQEQRRATIEPRDLSASMNP